MELLFSGHWADAELAAADAAGVPFMVLAERVEGGVGLVVVQSGDRLVTLSTAYAASGFDPVEASAEVGRFGFSVTKWTELGNGTHAARAVHEGRARW
ncbi:hypothetical protein [Streptomyces vinaceus]|uniref:hypothetical protein n=1 Tax=Streptomyces vinaceus TaxID=1960 RepID=UPI0038010C0C